MEALYANLFIGSEEIVTTPTHPFWVINAEWCSAIEIRAGDIIKLADGSTVTVTSTEYEKLDSPVKVFNFEVEDFHAHVSGNGPNTTVGLNRMPMRGHKYFSKKQEMIINEHWEEIERGIQQYFPKNS